MIHVMYKKDISVYFIKDYGLDYYLVLLGCYLLFYLPFLENQ